jgi:NAD(P)-dependent dehydrogenase (short-subunit alcohol dehydrogenase family)
MSDQRQRVIVTAGASGIGRAIAKRFLTEGADVAVCDIDGGQLEDFGKTSQRLMTVSVDVANSAQVNDFVAKVQDRFGGIDVLVNNAGIAGAIGPVHELSDEGWRQSFEINVHGMFYFIRAVVPIMMAQKQGVIVNISTGSTQTLPIHRAPYIASKFAVEGLTMATARELGPQNIRVNAIRPGFVNSARMAGFMEKEAKAQGTTPEEIEAGFLKYISMRSKVEASEIGDMAVFLGSDRAKHVTGQIIGVDGHIEWEQ